MIMREAKQEDKRTTFSGNKNKRFNVSLNPKSKK